MIVKPIVPHVYTIPLGFVNAFLIDDNGLTLIDTGTPGSSGKILQAIRELGRQPSDVRRILVTHCHADHTGSLAVVKRLTHAAVYMHPLDAALVRNGQAGRSLQFALGPFSPLARVVMSRRSTTTVEAARIDVELQHGQEIDGVSGLRAVHTPGHTAGHLVYLWRKEGGVLFLGDGAFHVLRLGYPPIFEDRAEAKRSLAKIAGLTFATACFAHGGPILKDAAGQFAGLVHGKTE